MFFFFSHAATPEIYTLSLHDALPISDSSLIKRDETRATLGGYAQDNFVITSRLSLEADRKSTRLNSSHVAISYAVFCLKKKNAAIDLQVDRHDFAEYVAQVHAGIPRC